MARQQRHYKQYYDLRDLINDKQQRNASQSKNYTEPPQDPPSLLKDPLRGDKPQPEKSSNEFRGRGRFPRRPYHPQGTRGTPQRRGQSSRLCNPTNIKIEFSAESGERKCVVEGGENISDRFRGRAPRRGYRGPHRGRGARGHRGGYSANERIKNVQASVDGDQNKNEAATSQKSDEFDKNEILEKEELEEKNEGEFYEDETYEEVPEGEEQVYDETKEAALEDEEQVNDVEETKETVLDEKQANESKETKETIIECKNVEENVKELSENVDKTKEKQETQPEESKKIPENNKNEEKQNIGQESETPAKANKETNDTETKTPNDETKAS